MKNIKCLITSLVLALGVGAAVGAVADRKAEVKVAEAAALKTFYLVSNWDWGIPRIHYWGGDNPTSWDSTPTMTKVVDSYTVDGKTGAVYKYDVPENTTGIIIRNNGKTQQTANYEFASWGGVSTNGAYFEWKDESNKLVACNYVPDVTVTRYAVINGGSPVKIDDVNVSQGSQYDVPAKVYREGYECEGWYTTQACTVKYTKTSVNSNMSIYAKYTTHAAWAGTVNIDLRNSGWADAAANYSILFMNKTTYSEEVTAWSEYITGTAVGERLVSVPYSLGFEPLTILVTRYNSSYSKASWDTEKFPTDGNAWGQTPDVDFNTMIRIGDSVDEHNHNYAYGGYPQVIGGTSTWSNLYYLDNVKSNGSHNVEYYSTTVTLSVGQKFKIQVAPYGGLDYYDTYSTYSLIEGNFEKKSEDNNNIYVKTAGTYAFYFDSYANSLYITTVDLAAADEWAQYFLSHVNCDATGKTAPSGWTACADEYAKLSGGAKDIVYGATAKEDGSYVEQAVARYDVALKNHPSLDPFIKNSSNVARSASVIKNNIITESTDFINYAIIAASGALILVEVSFLLLKRRKKNI